MTERADMFGMDPTNLWKQWYEMGSKMWPGVSPGGTPGGMPNGESAVDPWGLYRQWFEGMETLREQTMKNFGSMSQGVSQGESPMLAGADGSQAAEMWQRAVEATVEGWRKSAEFSSEMMNMTPRWMEMVDQARENLLAVEKYPSDPLEFAVQWYNATSGPYSEFVQELIERDEFLEPTSRFLQNYASLYKVLRKNNEEYLKNLQIPTRSDITRIASLVVALEEKVDKVDESLEELQDAAGSEPSGSDNRLSALEKRLDGVEGKLDRLLEAISGGAPADGVASQTNGASHGPDDEDQIKATNAARRKARDLGVDLSEVEGTGMEGQVTVDDVRRKGDA